MTASTALAQLAADRQALVGRALRAYGPVLEYLITNLDQGDLSVLTDDYLLEINTLMVDLHRCADRSGWSDSQAAAVQAVRNTTFAIAGIIRSAPYLRHTPTFYDHLQNLAKQLKILKRRL